MQIQETMRPAEFHFDTARYPLLATPKVDGIRAYRASGDLWTNSGRPVPNLNIRRALQTLLPDGIDMELFTRDFQSSMSLVMSFNNPIEGSGLEVFIFDYLDPDADTVGYADRILRLSSYWKQHLKSLKFIKPLWPVWIKSAKQVESFFQTCLAEGFEGICLRSPDGPYKFGRSTEDEQYLLKYKPFLDAEARIIAVEPLLVNNNPATESPTGKQERSSHQANKVPTPSLGSFTVRDLKSGISFSVGNGPGLTMLQRKILWEERFSLPGKIIKYRSMPFGVKEKPRQPQFLGFRDERDL